MKTILILGGLSKRFWPLSEKTLFPICGKTLVEHQVERLRAAGCDDILVVVGPHNKKEIEALLPGVRVIEQTRPALGMREAFLDALPQCGTQPVLLTHGNDVLDPAAYRAVIDRMHDTQWDGALLAQQVRRYFPGGYLTVATDGRISSIVEKPGEGKEPSDLVSIVAHAHRDASVLLHALQETQTDGDDGYEQALDRLFKIGRYAAVPYTEAWQAVKYPWHLLSLLPLLLADITQPSLHPTARIHPSAVIEGPVVIAEGAKIFPHASVIGPAYIGKHSIVGNNALVRESSIGDHCVVGYATEACRSIWHERVWTHMSYTGDSVIGGNVSFGAGCITGNLRLDEEEITSVVGDARLNTSLRKFGTAIGDDCRIGIRVAINPGVKIGGGCFVSGGCVIAQDIPEGSFVKPAASELTIRPNRTRPEGRDTRHL